MLVYRLPGTLTSREADLDTLWAAGATGLEERDGFVRAYFDDRADLPLDGAWTEEADRDWQAEWKKDLRPVQVGRVTVVPSWLADEAQDAPIRLIVDPGMAFGTGHHATTRLAIGALQTLDLTGQRVLDVGAGTGLLALVAAALGARAEGVDLDPITVPIARENADVNGLNVPFTEGTLTDVLDSGPWDVLVCNLYAELHDALMEEYAQALVPGGPLILTGILTDKRALVLAALDREGFTDVQVREDGEWNLITARNAG
ncbi:50S ribosomal protein L11 methyltransferase [Deinococcus maricopensis]|uniref:Ribosomal protein L11 methyltransferase n=1 Tax=Deinococcus maricopensis (strain DSM 21211 / LMG 22137 / NRRL B-23946 / LB-34) TaxID=709986 RepID=E8UB31_DEIML|nr:50S ribosomal protein L11 methyltransferase [Deinococcus maricopensis]ADV68270.1 Ribosomal protein L11 methyltransferase [Deinococcus maricopensis DSM 21211]